MALSTFARTSITRLRPTIITDRYGKKVESWDSPTEATIEGCVFEPVDSDESFSGAGPDLAIRWRLAAPEGTSLSANDRIRVAGTIYDIDGPPRPHGSPTGRLAYLEAFAKVTGAAL